MRPRIWAVVLSALFGLVLVWYLIYTQQLVDAVRADAAALSRMYARIFQDLSDPTEDTGVEALFDMLREIEQLGIPVVVTDPQGRPSAATNLPFSADLHDPEDRARVLEYAEVLDRRNEPIAEEGIGSIHFGVPAVVERLRWVPWLQAGTLVAILIAVFWIVRSTIKAEREQVWATMARESAHQLATPLSSLAGWVEILQMPHPDRAEVASDETIAGEVGVDVDRLTKVAHRFESIGRKPQLHEVDVGDVLRDLERYFAARLPRKDRSIELQMRSTDDLPPVAGNRVLLEWAFENLIKNSVDILAGRGGEIVVEAQATPDGVSIRVKDDGPGIPSELRKHVFEPGVSRKKGGWGVGLTLARRIVEETHGGSIALGRPAEGAEFIVELPVMSSNENAQTST